MMLGAGLPWQDMELEMVGGFLDIRHGGVGLGWVELSSRRRWPREEFSREEEKFV